MPGKFTISKGRNGKFYFNLKGSNGEIILASQGYSTRAGCRKGVDSVRTNGPNADRFEVKKASNGRSYFVLRARNGQVIGQSQMYKTARSRTNGVRSVQKNAKGAKVLEEE